MFITDQDAHQLADLAIRYASLKVGIREFGVIEHEELLARIAAKDEEVHKCLTSFLNNYKAWFEFHKKIHRENRQGQLTAAEIQQLMALTNSKDSARARIVEKLQSLPPA